MLTGSIALASADLPAAEAAWAGVVARSAGATAARLQLGREPGPLPRLEIRRRADAIEQLARVAGLAVPVRLR